MHFAEWRALRGRFFTPWPPFDEMHLPPYLGVVHMGGCSCDPAPRNPLKRTGPDLNRCEQQGRERKVTRSIGSGYGYGYGYDGQMSDPQGMPLTGNAPWGWGTTGHAANRHCPLE